MQREFFGFRILRFFVLGIFTFAFPKLALAMDAKDKAVAGQVLGGAMLTYVVYDTVKSLCNCAAISPCAPENPTQTCPSTGMNVMAALGAAGMILSAIETEDATQGGGGPGGFPTPDGGGGGGGGPGGGDPFGGAGPCDNDPLCSCSGPNAASNPLCSSNKPQALRDFANKIKDDINSGTLPLPENMTLDDFNSKFDQELGNFDTAVGIANGTIDPSALEGSGFGNFSKDGKAGAGGSKGGFSEDAVDGASGGGGGSGGLGSTVGPKDRSGLGKTVWNGLLDMLDDATGKSLTLWQRATRRYQGERGQRALLMARMEMIRNRGRKLAMERQSALKSKSVVKAAKKKSLSAKTKNPSAPKNQKAKTLSKSSAQSAPLK
jgi:hypothetical protein